MTKNKNPMKTKEEVLEPYVRMLMDEWPVILKKEALKAMDEYASQSKWISVEERLPEPGYSVLIYRVG
jgi:hypothetical protein